LLASLVGVICLLLLFFSQTSTQAHKPVILKGKTMGTSYSVQVSHLPMNTSQKQLFEQIEQQLVKINQKMSNWIADSELNKVNQYTTQQWISVSKPLFSVLSLAQEISKLSQGAFDITVAPLVNLWGFGPAGDKTAPPNKQQMEELRKQVHYSALKLDDKQQKVLKESALSLDLSAIAKGYGVDRLAWYLDNLEIKNYLVEIGGELRSKGLKDTDTPWRIAIETPATSKYQQQRQAQKIISMPQSGFSIATSGDYRNFFKYAGKKYSHTIDPITGEPVNNPIASVTVIIPNNNQATTARADALATSLMVMGLEKSLAFAEKNHLAVFLIAYEKSEFKEYSSSGFQKLIDP